MAFGMSSKHAYSLVRIALAAGGGLLLGIGAFTISLILAGWDIYLGYAFFFPISFSISIWIPTAIGTSTVSMPLQYAAYGFLLLPDLHREHKWRGLKMVLLIHGTLAALCWGMIIVKP